MDEYGAWFFLARGIRQNKKPSESRLNCVEIFTIGSIIRTWGWCMWSPFPHVQYFGSSPVALQASKVYVTATLVRKLLNNLHYITLLEHVPLQTTLLEDFFNNILRVICPEYLSSQLRITNRENSKSQVAVDVIVTCSNSWTCYWMSGHMPLLGWVKMTTICVARKSLKTRSTRIVEYNMQRIVRPVFQIFAKLFYVVHLELVNAHIYIITNTNRGNSFVALANVTAFWEARWHHSAVNLMSNMHVR